MRIAIDLTSLSYHITGIERFAMCITEEILKNDGYNEYVLLFRNEVHPNFRKYLDGKRVSAKLLYGNNKLIFFQIVMPVNLYKTHADNYLFFAFPAPVLFFNKNIYNTIHDMGRWDCPETTGLHLFYFKITESVAIKRAKHLFTVSEFSKKRICALTGFPDEKITVTYNGVFEFFEKNTNVDFTKTKEKLGIPSKYIMFLSTLQPRKNLKLLLEAFSEVADYVDYDLVLVGRSGWMIDNLIKKYKTNKRIVFTGFVKDEDVTVIYKNAICFVFPTQYEGFGIPPIEALSIGTPVISSDSSCMKEVLRNQAVYFANNNKDELKKLLLSLPDMAVDMPRELDEFQKENFSYALSATKILSKLEGEL